NAPALAVAVAGLIARQLNDVIAADGSASLVVPGGNTAKLVLPALATENVAWSKVTVTLADERWVSADHPDSNEQIVRETLLRGKAAKARLISLKTEASHPSQAIQKLDTRLSKLPRPFSCVFLGMGEDGHIASLFPGYAPDDNCDFVATDRPDHPRISLSPSRLLDARLIVLAISGDKKRETLNRAMEPGPVEEFPVRMLINADDINLKIMVA
ncbi:MAG: 6-phosphogluconolactonase, partial [Gammaproteobacteria bacterium]|nr:6-phosphogluconolactonase [Gammaproteobacteria bacterium]